MNTHWGECGHIDEDSFYDYHHHRSDDLLVAYQWQPNSDTQLDLREYYDVAWTDNAGINRRPKT